MRWTPGARALAHVASAGLARSLLLLDGSGSVSYRGSVGLESWRWATLVNAELPYQFGVAFRRYV
jgi:hypothetical protein